MILKRFNKGSRASGLYFASGFGDLSFMMFGFVCSVGLLLLF